MPVTLTNIPRIMRKQKPPWLNGARILDQWFSRPPDVAPNYGPPDVSTVLMDSFVLTFPRAKKAYDQILGEARWTTPGAKRQIIDLLDRNGLLTGAGSSFGNVTGLAPQFDASHIINVGVGNVFADPFDDMRAALGHFNFRVLVAGDVTPTSQSQWRIEIRRVGIYVWDSFDFEGDQMLGYWDDSHDIFYPIDPGIPGLTPVSNADFRAWRKANGKGGDFLVFSDIKETYLPAPDVLQVGPVDVLTGRLPGSLPPQPWPWRSTDPQQRWNLEFTPQGTCVWKERSTTGATLERTVRCTSVGDSCRIERVNDAGVLEFLGARPAVRIEIQRRAPGPSYMLVTRTSRTTATAEWTGLFWTLNRDNNLDTLGFKTRSYPLIRV